MGERYKGWLKNEELRKELANLKLDKLSPGEQSTFENFLKSDFFKKNSWYIKTGEYATRRRLDKEKRIKLRELLERLESVERSKTD